MSDAPRLRRTDKEMSDADAGATLARGHAGRLATVGPDGWPYVVPLLYVWADGEIWAHNSSARGHLRGNVEHDPRVCFEIDEPGEVFPYGRFECDTSLAYRSVIAFGRVRIVDDVAQKTRFFERLMAKYADPAWARPAGFFPRLDQVTVYAITIERMTGKQTVLPAVANRWPESDRTMSPNAVPPSRGRTGLAGGEQEDARMDLRATQLVGGAVQLELIDERHREELRRAADHDRIWEHTVAVVRGDGFAPWFSAALSARDGGHEVPFVVRLRATGRVVGSTRFLDPVERHRRVEIGATWYSPDTWGTVVNAECKLLLLRHAFDAWGANRVALLTDILNVRSQAAIRKLGAREEGVLRGHMVVKNGRVRDSVLFSITRPEWPAVRARLEERVRSATIPE